MTQTQCFTNYRLTTLTITWICLAIIALPACDPLGKAPGSQVSVNAYGKVVGQDYINEHFGLKLPIPEGWHIASEQSQAVADEIGKEMFSDETNAMTEATEHLYATALMITEYEFGAPVEFNPNISVMIENVSAFPGIKTTDDYLAAARLNLKHEPSMNILPGTLTQTLAGQTFKGLDVQSDTMGIKAYQNIYALKQGGYVILFTLSDNSPEGLKKLLGYLEKLEPLP